MLIGPPGVFLVDSKAWHGTITLALDGSAWHNGHPLAQTLATVRLEAQQLAQAIGVPVLPLLCVHDTKIPWDEIYIDNVPVLTPARLLGLLRSLLAHMDQVGAMLLAEHARHLPPGHLSRASSETTPGHGKPPPGLPRRGVPGHVTWRPAGSACTI